MLIRTRCTPTPDAVALDEYRSGSRCPARGPNSPVPRALAPYLDSWSKTQAESFSSGTMRSPKRLLSFPAQHRSSSGGHTTPKVCRNRLCDRRPRSAGRVPGASGAAHPIRTDGPPWRAGTPWRGTGERILSLPASAYAREGSVSDDGPYSPRGINPVGHRPSCAICPLISLSVSPRHTPPFSPPLCRLYRLSFADRNHVVREDADAFDGGEDPPDRPGDVAVEAK